MSVTSEFSGVGLAYVAREVIGTVTSTTVKFDAKLNENVEKENVVKDPMIVFFPNGTTQVLSAERAKILGFLEQPEIMNYASVQDGKSPAARYKNAIRERDRLDAWLDMENKVITGCVSKSGHPLPLDCDYSKTSFYLRNDIEEIAA